MNEKKKSGRRRLRNIIIAILVIVLFAYAVQITNVNLEEPLEPKRQENLVSLLRELANPELFTYDTESRSTNISIRMPCPEEPKASQVSVEGRVLTMVPNCATTTQDPITIIGEGFTPYARGIVRWYPAGAETTRQLGDEFETDENGNFETTFTMPDIRETEEPQRLEVGEVLDRQISGLSTATQETLNRIVETILMALMASTLGTFLAVPISFLGARNLMASVGAPLASIMAALIALPIGAFLGWLPTTQIVGFSETVAAQPIFALVALLVTGVVIALLTRINPLEGETSSAFLTVLAIIFGILLGIFALTLAAQLGVLAGEWLSINLSIIEILGIDFFGFIGVFVKVISELIAVLLPALIGLITGLIAASFASRYGQELVLKMSEGSARLVTAFLTLFGSAILVFAIARAITWLCVLGVCRQLPQETASLNLTLVVPSLLIGLIAALLSLRARPKRPYPLGMITYTITRTILNTLRAIEPILMGFVLVVWVGIGPFAGVLALMLHSIADLGKLFSEQVENIDEGPVEAVTATGAGGIQKVVYAVIPQVVPHYTAFIFYRWDINVRLSTIIGFVGGGGIGLILFRSTNLTLYRQASVMVIAIAVVVTVLDYVSSRIRKRII